MSALQVVGEDFLELLEPSPPDALEPVGVSLVQLGAERLRRGLVGRVADQQVAEPERVLARERRAVRPDRAPCGRGSSGSAARSPVRRGELRDHARRRTPCRTPRPLDHPRSSAVRRSSRAASSAWIVGGTATVGRSPVGDPAVVLADEQPVVDQHREHLLDEQRVAFGRGRRSGRRDVVGQLGRPEEVRRSGRRTRRRRAARARSWSR